MLGQTDEKYRNGAIPSCYHYLDQVGIPNSRLNWPSELALYYCRGNEFNTEWFLIFQYSLLPRIDMNFIFAHHHVVAFSTFMVAFLTSGISAGNAAVYYSHWLDAFSRDSGVTAAVGSCSIGFTCIFGEYSEYPINYNGIISIIFYKIFWSVWFPFSLNPYHSVFWP